MDDIRRYFAGGVGDDAHAQSSAAVNPSAFSGSTCWDRFNEWKKVPRPTETKDGCVFFNDPTGSRKRCSVKDATVYMSNVQQSLADPTCPKLLGRVSMVSLMMSGENPRMFIDLDIKLSQIQLSRDEVLKRVEECAKLIIFNWIDKVLKMFDSGSFLKFFKRNVIEDWRVRIATNARDDKAGAHVVVCGLPTPAVVMHLLVKDSLQDHNLCQAIDALGLGSLESMLDSKPYMHKGCHLRMHGCPKLSKCGDCNGDWKECTNQNCVKGWRLVEGSVYEEVSAYKFVYRNSKPDAKPDVVRADTTNKVIDNSIMFTPAHDWYGKEMLHRDVIDMMEANWANNVASLISPDDKQQITKKKKIKQPMQDIDLITDYFLKPKNEDENSCMVIRNDDQRFKSLVLTLSQHCGDRFVPQVGDHLYCKETRILRVARVSVPRKGGCVTVPKNSVGSVLEWGILWHIGGSMQTSMCEFTPRGTRVNGVSAVSRDQLESYSKQQQHFSQHDTVEMDLSKVQTTQRIKGTGYVRADEDRFLSFMKDEHNDLLHVCVREGDDLEARLDDIRVSKNHISVGTIKTVVGRHETGLSCTWVKTKQGGSEKPVKEVFVKTDGLCTMLDVDHIVGKYGMKKPEIVFYSKHCINANNFKHGGCSGKIRAVSLSDALSGLLFECTCRHKKCAHGLRRLNMECSEMFNSYEHIQTMRSMEDGKGGGVTVNTDVIKNMFDSIQLGKAAKDSFLKYACAMHGPPPKSLEGNLPCVMEDKKKESVMHSRSNRYNSVIIPNGLFDYRRLAKMPVDLNVKPLCFSRRIDSDLMAHDQEQMQNWDTVYSILIDRMTNLPHQRDVGILNEDLKKRQQRQALEDAGSADNNDSLSSFIMSPQ